MVLSQGWVLSSALECHLIFCGCVPLLSPRVEESVIAWKMLCLLMGLLPPDTPTAPEATLISSHCQARRSAVLPVSLLRCSVVLPTLVAMVSRVLLLRSHFSC